MERDNVPNAAASPARSVDGDLKYNIGRDEFPTTPAAVPITARVTIVPDQRSVLYAPDQSLKARPLTVSLALPLRARTDPGPKLDRRRLKEFGWRQHRVRARRPIRIQAIPACGQAQPR